MVPFICNKKALLSAVLIAMSLGHLACKTNKAPSLVEIVALNPNDPREFSLQVGSLSNVDDFTSLRNGKIKFLTNARLMHNLISIFAIQSSSFRDLCEALQESLHGQPLKLDLSSHNGILSGNSYESVLALTAFYHLNKIFDFANRNIGSRSDAITLPLPVAIYGQILSSIENPIPITVDDNALYVGAADTVFLLPLGQEQGLPLSMHEGVLAHEFHHRIFFKEVWTNSEQKNLWPLFQSRYDENSNRLSQRSRIILNALDEGLADVFAIAFTGLPNYLDISLTEQKSKAIKEQRSLNGRFAKVATYDSLADSNLPSDLAGMCGGATSNFENSAFNAYCLGTVIAKAIYEASAGNLTTLRQIVLPLIPLSLKDVAISLNQEEKIDLDIFFNAMARNTPHEFFDFKNRLCSQLKKRFRSLATAERIPSCKDFF